MESTTEGTAGGMVPAGHDDPAQPWGLRGFVITFAVIVTSIFLWWAFNQTLPYYAIAPGSAVDTSSLVKVDTAHAHPPKGKVLLTTVSLGRVSLLGALQGWLNPGVDVVQERVIAPPDVNEKQFRQLNLDAMEQSKKQAIGVALEALGVDAISGKGAEVVQVLAKTPADGAVNVGDTIVAVDSRKVTVDFEAVHALSAHKPGDHVTLGVVPKAGGSVRHVAVTLGSNPKKKGRAFLGVALSTKDLAFDLPFGVQLQSDRIGGPSAGLAFTLEVIDVLTPGELTGGRKIAATGTIELDGTVGEVGGVAQKTIAVKRSGASVFLVPRGEYAQAKKFAGKDLDVEIVDTLDDALRVLARFGGNGLALPKLTS